MAVISRLLAAVLALTFTNLARAENSPRIEQLAAPEGAPNVVVVLLDDVGFGAASTFGGPADTPGLEALAAEGLRYNRFHTTAICSPTRAALLTGRDAHRANVGTVMNVANAYPGYQGVLNPHTATVAEMLRQRGYSTAAIGKWHLAPSWETSPMGPFDRWPTGVGFEKFYGFMGGETDQFDPTLYEGTRPVMRPDVDNYHFTEDMSREAIEWLQLQHSLTPDKPFFLYYSTGAAHAPLQVPKNWIERYKGRFDQGWDAMREEIIARQKQLGVIPPNTDLTPRPDLIPAWDSLSDDQKKVAARLMETYAGFLAHTDAQVAKLVDHLKASKQFDNTLFFYVVGDNGSSAEGGPPGSINYMGALQGLQEPVQLQLAKLDSIGSAESYPQYPAGWAWALTTPFQWVKQVASHLGGTRNPLVVSWPRVIEDKGGLRQQFSHVNDIAPTILAAAGIEMPQAINGVSQLPMDGSSMLASFASATAPEFHDTQLFEVFGNRAIYHDGWMASARHDRIPWTVGLANKPSNFDDDRWELYNLDDDFSQAHDLSAEQPAKLAELQQLFNSEAQDLRILPLRNAANVRTPMPFLAEGRERVTYYTGTVGVPEDQVPNIDNRSWSVVTDVAVNRDGGGRGVLATMGGTAAGWSLYLDDSGRPVFEYRIFEFGQIRLQGRDPLPAGAHNIAVKFDYDGPGYAKSGTFTLKVDGVTQGSDSVRASQPAFFSIDETFDTGIDTGSPAGHYPDDAPLGYPLRGAILHQVDLGGR
ncbi:sulfatase-like hydrolase/transferase [Parahaliea maris]|uniref:Sulfatase-like hydrolase/transferase n=1 Tax=Parahaliea maris TaxID=2716870 RepID=A0A5C9A260_9GAMM|nr:arylsulfatase [Parahaliea maris]TXS93860.1 sulfatase-like hydrolase/transferase [Parahaliea maris]